MSIGPGTHTAKIVSHTITETKAGDPQASIEFAVGDDRIHWFGTFKEGKGRDITIKALLACGLKGDNPAGPLEIGREMSIVVDDETWEGTTRTKVKWINHLGAVKNMNPKDLAKAKLANLEGAVMAARQTMGTTTDTNEIPF